MSRSRASTGRRAFLREGVAFTGFVRRTDRASRAAKKPCNFVEWTLRGGQADALDGSPEGGPCIRVVGAGFRVPFAQRFQSLERKREVRASLAGDECMDLVDDQRVDRDQPLACVRRQQQEERLGCRNQNVGGVAKKS